MLYFMLNSNEPIKVAHLQKLANQSMLSGTLVIEMVNKAFSESKKNFGHLTKRKRFYSKKYKDMVSEKYISTSFRKISKLFRSAKEQQGCRSLKALSDQVFGK